MYEILNSNRRKTAEMGTKVLASFETMTQNPMSAQTYCAG